MHVPSTQANRAKEILNCRTTKRYRYRNDKDVIATWATAARTADREIYELVVEAGEAVKVVKTK